MTIFAMIKQTKHAHSNVEHETDFQLTHDCLFSYNYYYNQTRSAPV